VFHDFRKKKQSAHFQGFGFGLSFSIIFFCYAACYTLGAYLIEEGELEYYDMFRYKCAAKRLWGGVIDRLFAESLPVWCSARRGPDKQPRSVWTLAKQMQRPLEFLPSLIFSH
jgi:hypothetical protein